MAAVFALDLIHGGHVFSAQWELVVPGLVDEVPGHRDGQPLGTVCSTDPAAMFFYARTAARHCRS